MRATHHPSSHSLPSSSPLTRGAHQQQTAVSLPNHLLPYKLLRPRTLAEQEREKSSDRLLPLPVHNSTSHLSNHKYTTSHSTSSSLLPFTHNINNTNQLHTFDNHLGCTNSSTSHATQQQQPPEADSGEHTDQGPQQRRDALPHPPLPGQYCLQNEFQTSQKTGPTADTTFSLPPFSTLLSIHKTSNNNNNIPPTTNAFTTFPVIPAKSSGITTFPPPRPQSHQDSS